MRFPSTTPQTTWKPQHYHDASAHDATAIGALRGQERHASINRLEPLDERSPTHELTVYPGAQLTELKEKQTGDSRPQRGGGPRGPTSDVFTPRMRRTMEKQLGKLDLSVSFDFVTLTYPDNFERYPDLGFPTDPDDYLKDLTRWFEKLAYRWERVGIIWRLEFQTRRGAPHFHLLLYGLTGMAKAEVRAKLRRLWVDRVGAEDEETTRNGVHVERPRTQTDRKKCMAYLAKRNAAQMSSLHIEHRKRFWSCKGKRHLPEVEAVTTEITREEALRLRRDMSKYRDKTSRRKIGVQPHNPSTILRRGLASEWLRWTEQIVGEREYVDTRTGEVHTRRELQELAGEQMQSGHAQNDRGQRGSAPSGRMVEGNVDKLDRCAQVVLAGRRRARLETQKGAANGFSNSYILKPRAEGATEVLKAKRLPMLSSTQQVVKALLRKHAIDGFAVLGDPEEEVLMIIWSSVKPHAKDASHPAGQKERAPPLTTDRKAARLGEDVLQLKMSHFAWL